MPRPAPEPIRLPDSVWQEPATLDACRRRDANALLKLAPKWAGATNEALHYWTGIDRGEISKRLNNKHDGEIRALDRWKSIADALNMPDHARMLVGLAPTSHSTPATAPAAPAATDSVDVAEMERLRLNALDVLSGDLRMAPSSVDDWELTVVRHGRATRFRASGVLIAELLTDLAELQGLLRQRPSLSVFVRLSRVSSQLSGLISLTLLKLGEPTASRRWSKAAWLGALEVGDPALSSWVKAQDAYADFYAGDPAGATLSAQQAQDVSGTTATVGYVLAAALEARAQAVLGRRELSLLAIGRAELAFGRLADESIIDSAFGYDEGQLRFHQGDALTRLGDSDRAVEVLREALTHYGPDNYLDRALILLNQAESLAKQDPAHAAGEALAAIAALDESRRDPLIMQRAQDVARILPDHHEQARLHRGLADLSPRRTTANGA